MVLDDLPSMALYARVVQFHSFSAAARASGIAKSAVSKRVAQLERRLGVRLLNRTTRAVSPTAEGVQYYAHCAELLAAAEAAEQAIVGTRDRPVGRVRVNAPVTFSQMYLAQALARFVLKNPGVEIDLTTDDRLVDVVQGGFDVVVRISSLRESSLVARRLAPIRLLLCAAPDYLTRAGTPERPEDLIRHNCLHYSLIAASAEWRFRAKGKAFSVPVRGTFTSTDGTTLRQAAVAGLGLAVLPDFMAAGDLAAGRLVTVLDQEMVTGFGLYAMHVSRSLVPARVRVLLDFLIEYFTRPNWTQLAGPSRVRP